MKLCITARGRDLDAQVDPMFGRAQVFLRFDTETGAIEAIDNAPGAHGAGVQAAQQMVNQGVSIVITGQVGPNAYQGLAAAGIKVHVGASGTVREAIAAYEAGQLQRAGGPTGMRHGGGGGRGRGGGR